MKVGKLIFREITSLNVGKHIKKQTRKDGDIIYGGKSMNKQLAFGFLGRPTFDFDIYSKKPKRSAKKLERTLDKESKGDYYYTKPAIHEGTYKVMDIGKDNKHRTEDDFNVADYSKPKRKIRVVTIGGIKYAHTSETIRDKKKAVRDPQYKYRRIKDKQDLETMKSSNRLRKGIG